MRMNPPQHSRIVSFSTSCNLLNSSTYKTAYTRDPGEVFFKEDVQILLQRLTGCDFDKVFRKRKLGTKLQTPTYELLTEDEVDKLMEETRLKAKERLKMPPLLQEREPIKKVLARNPELQGFDNCTYLFTDISQGISDRNRVIVARDPDGILREASWEERQKMCQVYFPAFGREIHVPKMFEDQHLDDCLSQEAYEFVLDRACTQFEPDDPDYIRVTRKTYDHIDKTGKYADLRSTRHFGPMALHLVLSKQIDGLMFHFISKQEIASASDLVRLFHTVETGASNPDVDEIKLVEDYIKEHALKKPSLQLAWDTYLEIEKQRMDSNSMAKKQSN